jgi:queuine tRNA-ribosyltransferase
MSLSNIRKITDEGVTFRSHLDGSEMFMSPESSIQIQGRLGVDISMAFDECAPYPSPREDVARAMHRTHAWALRCLEARGEDQAVFGIVQGGVHEDLRRESAGVISEMAFDGFAIGGVSVGEPADMQYPVVSLVAPLLPSGKARYLMGVGHPRDIIHAVAAGVDMFDCVLPTRMARHHGLYTLEGRVNISGARWENWNGPVDELSVFPQTERYSAAYMRHLFKVNEPLGPRLATLHNLAFYARLMREIREAIEAGTWAELVKRYEKA